MQRPAFDVDEFDEWEAFAPYPDYVVQAAHEAATESHDSYSPFSRHEEPAHARQATDARHNLHDAIESLTGEPDKLAPPKPADASSSGPAIRRPRCLSSRIDTRNRARKVGSTIRSVAGATGGKAAALAGAETGAVVGSIAGPVGTLFGGRAGAVIAGLVGSASGAPPAPQSEGPSTTTCSTIITASPVATPSAPRKAEQSPLPHFVILIFIPVRYSPGCMLSSIFRRLYASRSLHGLRRPGTVTRTRQQARSQATARGLGACCGHGLAHRRSQSALRRRRQDLMAAAVASKCLHSAYMEIDARMD